MSDRKRRSMEYSEGSKGGIKRSRLERAQYDSPFSEQEISVHPYEDDFNFELDSPDQEDQVTEHSPNVTLEPGLDILIDSPAFPLSKTLRETSKRDRRRYRGGTDDSPEDIPKLTKSTTLPVVDSRRNREKDSYSRSRSKSPYSSEPTGTKSRVIKRNTSGGHNSPMSRDESRYSDQYSGRGGEGRERRSKHLRSEHRSKQSDSRENDSRKIHRDSRMPSREQSVDSYIRGGRDHYGSASVDLGTLGYKRDKRYLGEDRGVSGLKRRSPSRREATERYSEHRRREREDRREKPYREATKVKKRHHHKHQESDRVRSQKLPEVVLRGSGDEAGGVELLPDKIEDLIKDIQESSTDSSSDEEPAVKESVEGQMKSPESVSSRSFSSPEEGRSKSVSPVDLKEEREEAMEETGDKESEGEAHSPSPANPYVMRSRFDTSDHSDYSDDDTNQAQSQQGLPRYPEQLSGEGSGASAVNSPEPPQDMATDPPSPLHDSPEPPPVPALPPYLPGLMGCKNVESYEWLDRIEEGTYGVVYKAKDKRTGEIVALKKLKMEKEKEGFPITSLREINMLLKAAHPNIVPVREIVVGSNMDKIYIVMDFIKHDLKALMSTMKEKFLEGEVKTLMIHLLRAVHHMHDNWILHRDLKTSNLLLSHDNILKVADFGLAREYGSPLLNYTPVVVTLWYRSPELLLGAKEYSTAVDVWSVGCIFAELLLHKALFTGRSEIDQLNKIFTELGTPNEKIWPGFKQLPGAKNVTFTQHPQGNLRKKYPQLTTQTGFDLLFKLLAYDPKKRITAKDALDHQYFRDMPRPVPPQMFPTWPTKSEIAKNKQKREKSPTPPEGGAFVLKGVDQLGSPGPGFSLKF